MQNRYLTITPCISVKNNNKKIIPQKREKSKENNKLEVTHIQKQLLFRILIAQKLPPHETKLFCLRPSK